MERRAKYASLETQSSEMYSNCLRHSKVEPALQSNLNTTEFNPDGAYQIAGNIDQRHGGIQIVMDGGRNWHIRDYTDKANFIYVDTETTGCNPMEESPVSRASLYCWSLSYFPNKLEWGLRGQPLVPRVFFYGKPEGLSLEMLQDEEIGKGNHQCHYDTHVLWNAGVAGYRPGIDSLRLSRLLNPHRKKHGLEELMFNMLGYRFEVEGKGGKFKKLFSKPAVSEKTGKLLKRTEPVPLDEIPPYSPLFCRLVDYSTLDTKAGLEITYLLLKEIMKRRTYKLPDYMVSNEDQPGWLRFLREFVTSS